MTSKEALEELYKEREYLLGEKVNNKTKNWHNDITHYDNISHCLLTIKQDLERLEQLEKVLEIIKNKCAANTNIWLVVCTRTYEDYESFGKSFNDYLAKYRMEKAASLLVNTNKKIITIAEKVGYQDVDYFVNRFVLAKGCTPTKYRKRANVAV